MRRYKWKQIGGWSKDVGLTRLMTAAGRSLISGKGPFTLTQDGDPVVIQVTRLTLLKKLRTAVSRREIGGTFRVRDRLTDTVFVCRAVLAYSDADTTSGNAKADKLWNWIRTEHQEYEPRYAGAYVCKLVSGSTTRSQHSYGNALDVFFETLAQQDAVARQIVMKESVFHPYHVISRNQVWTKGEGWHSYSGTFHSHLHVDFDPPQSGACGVRG